MRIQLYVLLYFKLRIILTKIKFVFPFNRVVAVCDGYKIAKSNGFSFSFIEYFWILLRGEFGVMFSQLYNNGNYLVVYFNFFFTLLLKIESLFSLYRFQAYSQSAYLNGLYIDFRPITYCQSQRKYDDTNLVHLYQWQTINRCGS